MRTRPALIVVLLAIATVAVGQPPLRMYPTDPPAGRMRRAVRTAATTVSVQWCRVGGGAGGSDDATTGPLSTAALRDLKAAGIDGVVLDDADGNAAERARAEGLETTASEAMRGGNDGAVAQALFDLLARSGDGAKPSAFAKSVAGWMMNAGASQSALVFGVPADAAITSAAATRGGGTDSMLAERLNEITSMVCAALTGNAVWAQDQIQRIGASGAEKRLIEFRRTLLKARRNCAALTGGSYSILVADNEDDIYAFGRVLPESVAMVVVSNADRDRTVEVPGVRLTARGAREGMVLKTVALSTPAEGTRGGIVTPTASATVTASAITVNLPPMSALLMVSEK